MNFLINSKTDVILLAAGYGKRLGSLTKETPKCLIKLPKINNALSFWINFFLKTKAKKIIINTHYLAEKIISEIKKFNTKKIFVKHEETLRGGLGTILDLAKQDDKNSDFLIVYSDTIFLSDPFKGEFLYKSKLKNKFGCIFVSEAKKFGEYGYIVLKDNKLNFIQKPKKFSISFRYIFNGLIFINNNGKNWIKSNVTDNIKRDDFVEFFLIPNINLFDIFITNSDFFDIGTVDNLKLLTDIYDQN